MAKKKGEGIKLTKANFAKNPDDLPEIWLPTPHIRILQKRPKKIKRSLWGCSYNPSYNYLQQKWESNKGNEEWRFLDKQIEYYE